MSSSQEKNTISNSESNPSIEERMLTLKSDDGDEFVIKEWVALLSVTIKNLVDGGCAESGVAIPVFNVDGKVLLKVIEYLNNNAEFSNGSPENKKAFEEEFTKGLSNDEMLDLLLAANYLEIKDLFVLLIEKVAKRIENETPEEVRKIFNIENDFTKEEEKAIRDENEWAFH